mgnify:CR=1 FL=1
MSMQLKVVHTTGYKYDGSAAASYNEARMSPRTTFIVAVSLGLHGAAATYLALMQFKPPQAIVAEDPPVVVEYWQDASSLSSATPVTVTRGSATTVELI